MSEWINFKERMPNKYPCKGRNYDLHIEDVLTGYDQYNKAFPYPFFCKSLPFAGISMPFTHWLPIEEDK